MKNEPHIMVDLETMGQHSDAAISQIGAVLFYMDGRIEDTFEANVDLQSCVDVGLKTDQDTVRWWMKQSDEARSAWAASQEFCAPLQKALANLRAFLTRSQQVYLWSHGSTFDIPILDTAYRLEGLRRPWNYQRVRDTRTLFSLCLEGFDPWVGVTEGLKHRALDDARRQAQAVINAYKHVTKVAP